MPLPGSASPNWFTSWLRLVVTQLIVGGPPAAPPVAFDGAAQQNSGLPPPDDLFGLWVGPQGLHPWTGADVCAIVPSYGEPSQPMAFRTTGTRRVIGATSLGVDIHIWGTEPVVSQSLSLPTIEWDIARYERPEQIYQNVMRAIYYASMGDGIAYGTIDGWQNETEIQRYGEAILVRLAVSFPIYDFEETPIPQPQTLDPRVSIKAPGT